MSKYKLVRINNKEDIDTSKVSVYELNNRYMDTAGTMYALKYNRIDRKIEIITLLMTHIKNASTIHHQVIQKKINDNLATFNDKPNETEESEIENSKEEFVEDFNSDTFIKNALIMMKTHRDRLKGIMMNVTNSNVVSDDDKTDSTKLEDLYRNIDLDGIQKIDKIDKYHKELTEYPRSITYYQAKLDQRGRETFEKLNNNNERMMNFVYCYEMHSSLSDFYKSLSKFVGNLRDFLDSKNIEELNLSKHENQSFEDAMLSITTTIDDIDEVIEDLARLYDFMGNDGNFNLN